MDTSTSATGGATEVLDVFRLQVFARVRTCFFGGPMRNPERVAEEESGLRFVACCYCTRTIGRGAVAETKEDGVNYEETSFPFL